jgi:hypothetical protein
MIPRSLIFCLGFCAIQLCAQERVQPTEAQPWGVAVVMGHETGDRSHFYGKNYGLEITRQFLRDHWVQGRLRGSLVNVGKGNGAPDGLGFTPMQAKFLAVSCDWIFRPMKAHGPYLLLGAGGNYHQADRYYIDFTDSTSGSNFNLAWGVGWLIANQVEIELRQDAFMVDFNVPFGGNRDVLCTSLVLRKRF